MTVLLAQTIPKHERYKAPPPWQKALRLAGLAVLLHFPISCAEPPPSWRIDGTLTFYALNGSPIKTIDIEIAESPEEKLKGLMYRVLEDDTKGMLFVYDNMAPRVFWMKNTPSSLDMLFLDDEKRIQSIAKKTTPLSDTRYQSEGPAQYVIEVQTGFIDRHGIEKGSRVSWEKVTKHSMERAKEARPNR